MDGFAANPQLRLAPPLFAIALSDAREQDLLFGQCVDPCFGAFVLAGVPMSGQERQRGEGEQHDREAAEPRVLRRLPGRQHAEQRGEGDRRGEHGRPGVRQPERDADDEDDRPDEDRRLVQAADAEFVQQIGRPLSGLCRPSHRSQARPVVISDASPASPSSTAGRSRGRSISSSHSFSQLPNGRFSMILLAVASPMPSSASNSS